MSNNWFAPRKARRTRTALAIAWCSLLLFESCSATLSYQPDTRENLGNRQRTIRSSEMTLILWGSYHLTPTASADAARLLQERYDAAARVEAPREYPSLAQTGATGSVVLSSAATRPGFCLHQSGRARENSALRARLLHDA